MQHTRAVPRLPGGGVADGPWPPYILGSTRLTFLFALIGAPAAYEDTMDPISVAAALLVICASLPCMAILAIKAGERMVDPGGDYPALACILWALALGIVSLGAMNLLVHGTWLPAFS
jgi:hypothetical protein